MGIVQPSCAQSSQPHDSIHFHDPSQVVNFNPSSIEAHIFEASAFLL